MQIPGTIVCADRKYGKLKYGQIVGHVTDLSLSPMLREDSSTTVHTALLALF